MPKDVDAQRTHMLRGEQLDNGWCYDGDRDPDIFRCGEREEAVARGDTSVSYDGTMVLDLKAGTVKQGKPIERNRPVTLAEMQEATGGKLPATTAADTKTTDNAPAGTGRGAAARP